MPKKKTGQRKKAEKQKLRQKEIRTAKDNVTLAKYPSNSAMEAEEPSVLLFLPESATSAAVRSLRESEMYVEDWRLCHQACWSVHHRPRHGGKSSCAIRHAGVFTTGLGIVVSQVTPSGMLECSPQA
uniref:Uncharacterized protein n=1 Tax=Timema tahoe TaxID=61484 RepID=A0A7R9IQ07_9NEOP|nr:unnamed protein product [Timema tahoe]